MDCSLPEDKTNLHPWLILDWSQLHLPLWAEVKLFQSPIYSEQQLFFIAQHPFHFIITISWCFLKPSLPIFQLMWFGPSDPTVGFVGRYIIQTSSFSKVHLLNHTILEGVFVWFTCWSSDSHPSEFYWVNGEEKIAFTEVFKFVGF